MAMSTPRLDVIQLTTLNAGTTIVATCTLCDGRRVFNNVEGHPPVNLFDVVHSMTDHLKRNHS